ncbi:Signal transduction histidine kinase [Nonomuraea solani]|uniref:Oxygen sensor histidine kinase NreB n=1 Tax=Nonomuraea solani TaxID=1144553 RepID=A0A1H6E8A5_9ACTN|nr:sensor histidine kinase [Nonomuraea solani]SEG93950.1 Signal transduction histidine kinase [Nonomuraea solani]
MSWIDGRERWVFAAYAYGLLAISSTAATITGTPASTGPAAPQPDVPSPDLSWSDMSWPDVPWPALALAAALWLAPVPWLYPRRDTRRALVIGHYLALLALATALAVQSTAFVVFASVGYPLAIAMLPARLVMAGVTLTAVASVASQAGPGAQATLFSVIAGVAGPLVLAGWYVAAEHDKRRRLVERLRAAMDENADLHARLLDQARNAGVQDERHRMAGEIHDTLAQDLVALIGQLDAATRTAQHDAQHDAQRDAQRDPRNEPLRLHLDRAAELARRGLSEVRRSVHALRPEPLEDARLPEALGRMARSWADAAGVDLRVEITGTPVALSADVETALFRVAQEALANVAKHARATRTALTLSYTDETILLDVRDDGTGFAPQKPADGFGLDGMRQRVRGLGGTLDIESAPGHGTAIAAAVPAVPADGGDHERL